MRLAIATLAVLATAATRGGCGSEPGGPGQSPTSCLDRACGSECVGSSACVASVTPCDPDTYVGQCDAQGFCRPPGTQIACGAMAPCDGKACGDSCDPCAPAACMSPVAYACDLSHQCVPTAPDLCGTAPGDCVVDGKVYHDGDSFPAGDGCNECVCLDGQVACTLMLCLGQWYYTCGDPVCREWSQDPSVPPCTTEKVDDSCTTLGATCDPKSSCNERLLCSAFDPIPYGGCPISRARYKTDIQYLDGAELDRVRDDLMKTRLATYRYRAAGPGAQAQLGFIIDDVGAAPSVNADGETVNLYGYTSMAVAALQSQEREIAALRREVASLRRQVEAKAKPAARPRR